MRDLHTSLSSAVIGKSQANGVQLALAKLQWSKSDIVHSVHASPNTFSSYGFQRTDFLSLLGLTRQPCSFLGGECFTKEVSADFPLDRFASAFDESFRSMEQAERSIEACGYRLPQPEGWGYFYGKSGGVRDRGSWDVGEGHFSSVSPNLMKQSEDERFKFLLSWIELNGEKGWTIHYLPKHLPLSVDLNEVFSFLGIKPFAECPHADFEPCWWKFIQFQKRGDGPWNSNAEVAHRFFEAHEKNFSVGVQNLLGAHSRLEPYGFRLLPMAASKERLAVDIQKKVVAPTRTPKAKQADRKFDVAISYAGSERQYAEELAKYLQERGVTPFYDGFYPEELWGKDLAELFHEIYSKQAQYCVMFVSASYRDREWTVHERRSAQERMIKEKGKEYILPIQVEKIELPGLPSTVGYLDLSMGIPKIGELLIKKLKLK